MDLVALSCQRHTIRRPYVVVAPRSHLFLTAALRIARRVSGGSQPPDHSIAAIRASNWAISHGPDHGPIHHASRQTPNTKFTMNPARCLGDLVKRPGRSVGKRDHVSFRATHWVCSRENAFSASPTNEDSCSSVLMLPDCSLIRPIS